MNMMPQMQEVTPEQYHELWLDLPFGTPMPGKGKDEAMKVVGCCLKSHRRESNGCNSWFGRLQRYDQDTDAVTVISYPREKPCFRWDGTIVEYHAFWACD